MIAALVFVASASQDAETGVAAYVHAHREADRALLAGKSAEARTDFEKCLELAPKNATVAYGLACSYAKAGERDRAFEWLSNAVAWGYADAELALWDSDFANVRDDERFKSAVEAMRKLVKGPASKKLALIKEDDAQQVPVTVAIDRAASRIAVAWSTGELAVLDARTGKELVRSTDLGSTIWDIAIQPSGERVVALTEDGKVHFWSPGDAQPALARDALDGSVEEDPWPSSVVLAFDPTGERVLVGSSKHGASLWRASGDLICKLTDDFSRFGASDFAWNAVGLAWSSDGSRIAAWQKSIVRFVDGRTGAVVDAHIDASSPVLCLDFDPTGKWIATGHDDGRARLWDATTLKLVRETESVESLGWVVFYVNALKFSPQGDRIALTTGKGVVVHVLDTSSFKPLWTSEHLGGRMGEPVLPTWSSDGRRLWSAFASGVMWIEQIDVADKFRDSALARGSPVQVSPGGRATFLTSGGVTALDTKTGAVLWTKVSVGGDRELFHTPGGWFDASFDDVRDLSIHHDSDDEKGTPLASLATQLFDPRRVRAAKAGVALAPVHW